MSCLLRRATLALLGLLLAVGAPATARAQDTTSAREHYQRGTSFYDLGRYADAIQEFEAAYEIKNDPALLYNRLQSYRLAGNSEQALHFYRTYLRYVPKAPNRAEIESRIAQLEQLVAQKNAAQTTPPNQAIPPGATSPPTSEAPGAATPAVPPACRLRPPRRRRPPSPRDTGARPALRGRGDARRRRDAGPHGGTAAARSAGARAQPEKIRLDHGGRCWRWSLFIVGAIFGNAAVGASRIRSTCWGTQAGQGGRHLPDPKVEQRGKNDQAAEAGFMVLGGLVAAAGGTLYFYGRSQEQASVTAVATSGGFGAVLRVTF